jgi:sulfur carrier protein
MRIEINGEPVEVTSGLRLGQLVDARTPARRGVAVALDGEVVPRADWDGIELHEHARVEIVGAVQGG